MPRQRATRRVAVGYDGQPILEDPAIRVAAAKKRALVSDSGHMRKRPARKKMPTVIEEEVCSDVELRDPKDFTPPQRRSYVLCMKTPGKRLRRSLFSLGLQSREPQEDNSSGGVTIPVEQPVSGTPLEQGVFISSMAFLD